MNRMSDKDTIYRQDAIDAIFGRRHDIIKARLKNLPSAQPRKKGKWIIEGHHILCNRCENIMCNRDREGDLIPRNFCPNCGSYNGGEESE